MDNICQFSPLWQKPELVSKPQKDIESIRLKSLQLFLNKHRSQLVTSLGLDQILLECRSTIEQLLLDTTQENEILRRIRGIGVMMRTSPLEIVEASLTAWYASSVPAFTRDARDILLPDYGRPRRNLGLKSRQAQYGKIAAATGRPYPARAISPQFADRVVRLNQEYLLTVPLLKTPMTDLSGHLTLPFMNTALKAIRFHEEPPEPFRHFWLVSFW
ncbi:hypothetical protein ED733_003778 [Metarhizium rileyi]|uniref:Uncharacterized protein n=1 Tax=Metarhizium rileyi (strain RCEF 4871) TaxID=1649241 RepID=A0A5C6GCZ8_METRR|nr:hypothetical protein ED733_003778 [Metarhizium rileyi]